MLQEVYDYCIDVSQTLTAGFSYGKGQKQNEVKRRFLERLREIVPEILTGKTGRNVEGNRGTHQVPGKTLSKEPGLFDGKGKVSEPGQNYTLEEPKTAIDFKLKPKQIDLPFGKKSDIFSSSVPHARRRMAIPTTWSELHSGNVVKNAGDAFAKGIMKG